MKPPLYRIAVLTATLATTGCDFNAIEAKTHELKTETDKVYRTTDSVGREHQSLILETSRLQTNVVRPEPVAAQLRTLEEKLVTTNGELEAAAKTLEEKKAFLSNYTAQFGKR